jgi:hypothetical protein
MSSSSTEQQIEVIPNKSQEKQQDTNPDSVKPLGTEQQNQDVPKPTGPRMTDEERQLREMVVSINKEKYKRMQEDLEKDIVRLEYVKSNGETAVETRNYSGLTLGKSKKVAKIMKRVRLIARDLGYFRGEKFDLTTLKLKYNIKDEDLGPLQTHLDHLEALEKPKITLEDIKSKYKDIVDEDTDEIELTDRFLAAEMIGTYVIGEKAKLYFGIEDPSKYSLSDILALIGLYEIRNQMTPS